MRIVAILQARMGSTRLPGKVMLPLAGKPMVQNIVERVSRANLLHAVVVAMPNDGTTEDPIFQLCFKNNIAWAMPKAEEDDLVERYLRVAEDHHADLIVRVPCDNPCVDPDYIDKAIENYKDANCPFYSNTTECVNGHWIDGIGAEVFSISRLKLLDELSRGIPRWREHPHLYFDYNFPSADYRLDVNTHDDYLFINDIYDHFGHNRFTTTQVLAYLSTKEVPHESQQIQQPSAH